MASTIEIVLLVLVILGLLGWYYTSVYRPACKAKGQHAAATHDAPADHHAPAEHHTPTDGGAEDAPMTASGSRFAPLDDPATFSTVNRRVIPADHVTLSLAKAEEERDRPQDGAHLRSLPTDIDEDTGAPVVPAGPAGGMGAAVLSNDLFSTFEEAPAGVTAAMWPSSADEDEAEPASTGTLPGGADNARAVESAIVTANKTRVQEDVDGHVSMKYGAKAMARNRGAQAGATSQLYAAYFGCGSDAKPKVDMEHCKSMLYMPPGHVCEEMLQSALDAERRDAKYVSGVSSMAYREFLQPAY